LDWLVGWLVGVWLEQRKVQGAAMSDGKAPSGSGLSGVSSLTGALDDLAASDRVESSQQRLEVIHEKKSASKFSSAAGSLLDALGDIDASESTEARLKELKTKEEEKRFTSAASSLTDALDDIRPVKKCTLLEDTCPGSGRTLGKGLSVIDQFAMKVHTDQVDKGIFGSFSKRSAVGGKTKGMSKKANKRKAKAQERAIGYGERRGARSGPSRKSRGRNSRLALI